MPDPLLVGLLACSRAGDAAAAGSTVPASSRDLVQRGRPGPTGPVRPRDHRSRSDPATSGRSAPLLVIRASGFRRRVRPRRPALTDADRRRVDGTGGRGDSPGTDEAAGRSAAQHGGMDKYEYRVLQVRESMIGGKLSPEKLERLLNDEARQGWRLKAVTSADVKGRIGPGGVDGLLVTFERLIG